MAISVSEFAHSSDLISLISSDFDGSEFFSRIISILEKQQILKLESVNDMIDICSYSFCLGVLWLEFVSLGYYDHYEFPDYDELYTSLQQDIKIIFNKNENSIKLLSDDNEFKVSFIDKAISLKSIIYDNIAKEVCQGPDYENFLKNFSSENIPCYLFINDKIFDLFFSDYESIKDIKDYHDYLVEKENLESTIDDPDLLSDALHDLKFDSYDTDYIEDLKDSYNTFMRTVKNGFCFNWVSNKFKC